MTIRRDQIKLINVWYILQAICRSVLKQDYIAEQVAYRKMLINKSHPECLSSGECYCGCETEEMIWSDKECVHKCYPPFKNKIEWNLFKIQNKIFDLQDN